MQPSDRSVEPVQENIFPTPTHEVGKPDTPLKEEIEPLELKKSQYQHDILVIDTHPPKVRFHLTNINSSLAITNNQPI